MLPHFVGRISATCSKICSDAGYRLSPNGSRRISSSASRLIGEFAQRGIELELRHALEPWHVLGEEAGAGGTVRYVDSSLERMQVKVTGLTDERHVVTCNGRRVPLHADRRPPANSWPACATAPGSRRSCCIRPSACMRR